jgi:hypothetical protein
MKKRVTIFTAISALVTLTMMIAACAVGSGSGHLQVHTPDFSEISRGIYNSDNTFIKDASSDGRLRFEVGVEAFGQRIISAQLKPGDDTLLTVPAGIPLTIGVGIYLVESATDEKETINAYLVSDVKDQLVLIPGETRYLDYVLDTSEPTIVDSYYQPHVEEAPGLSSIRSGVLNDSDGNPYFSVFDFTSGIKNLMFNHATEKFEEKTNNEISTDLGAVPPGLIFEVEDPDNLNYWHISDAGIKRGTSINSGTFSAAQPSNYDAESLSKLPGVRNVEFINYEYSPGEFRYIWFFSYGEGYVSLRYDSDVATQWSFVETIDFGDYFSVLPNEAFVLDVEQDTTSDIAGVIDNRRMVFFATKIGLFYLSEDILHDLKAGVPPAIRRQKLLSRANLINIPNPANTNKNLTVTSVKATGNRIFLGTRSGVYMVDKNSEFWKVFANSGKNTVGFLNPKALKKLPAFPTEPVISNELYSTDIGEVLVLATTRKVIFTRFNDSDVFSPDVQTVTVWDGIPFIPKVDIDLGFTLDSVDFISHDVSRLSFVLYDEAHPAGPSFWIGTYHGLGSVPLSRLFQ